MLQFPSQHQIERLSALVGRYLKGPYCGPNCFDEELPFMDGIAGSVRIACASLSVSNRRLSHQRRIPHAVLGNMTLALLAQKARLGAANNFDELHAIVDECRVIHGVGPLLVYDVASRIGNFLGLKPTYVYLHSGTAKGAKAFGFGGDKIALSQLPEEISMKLTAGQTEDFLCIFKAELRALNWPLVEGH